MSLLSRPAEGSWEGAMRASRRTRFVAVEECTVLYDHPCGCEGNKHRLADGCWHYSYDGLGTKWDLFECRQCGAVWTLEDAPPFTFDMWQASFDNTWHPLPLRNPAGPS